MVDEEHLSWLKQGVEFWNNKRREDEKLRIDLRNADISGQFGVSKDDGPYLRPEFNLRGIDLNNAYLNGAILKNGDLAGADFLGAHLQEADFTGSDFAGARFYGTFLNGAVLQHCNFRDVNFYDTKLNYADLSDSDMRSAEFLKCDLSNADLRTARLEGAVFPLSKPWQARLFQSQDGQDGERMAFPEDDIASVEDLIAACREFRNGNDDDLVLFFRGEGRHIQEWELRPSVMRIPDKPDRPNLRRVEGEMLIDLIARQPEAFSNLNSGLVEWVLAQHYLLPTRFLDVSRNPLVGLFNACWEDEYREEDGRLHVFAVPRSLIKPFNSDTVSVIANVAKLRRWEKNLLLGKTHKEDNDEFHPRAKEGARGADLMSRVTTHLYDGIRQEKPYFERRIDIRDLLKVFVVEPQMMFERIRAQSGAFLLSAYHERFESPEVLDLTPDIPMYSHYPIRVCGGSKCTIMKDLSQMNLTKEVLYPGVEESAKAVGTRHRSRGGAFYANLTPSD